MPRQKDEAARLAAVLHDTVEDTPTTLADLRSAGYSEEICEAIDRLTRRAGEPYEEMIARVAGNAIGRRVKLVEPHPNPQPEGRSATRQIQGCLGPPYCRGTSGRIVTNVSGEL